MDFTSIGIDNRKLATIIWLLISAVFFLRDEKIRRSILEMIRTFANPKVLFIFTFSSVYSALTVWTLYRINFWHLSMLADTIIWLFGTSYALIVTSNELHKPGEFVLKMRGYFSATILLDFLINTYPMRLFFELLLLPFLTLLFLVVAVSEHNQKFHEVERLTKSVLSVVGFFLFIYALYSLIFDINNIEMIPFAENLFLLPLLTIFYIPFIYLLVVFLAYNALFHRFIFYKSAKGFITPSRWKVFKQCHFSLYRLDEYSKKYLQEYLRSTT